MLQFVNKWNIFNVMFHSGKNEKGQNALPALWVNKDLFIGGNWVNGNNVGSNNVEGNNFSINNSENQT